MTAKSAVAVEEAQIITPPSLDGWYEVFVAIHGMFLPNMVLCIITTHFYNGHLFDGHYSRHFVICSFTFVNQSCANIFFLI